MSRSLITSLLLCILTASCTAPRESTYVSQPATSAVKSRLRGAVPVVLMGLQDQVALQRPTRHSDVWRESTGNAAEDMKGLGHAAGHMDRAAFVLLPFFALTALMPPVKLLTSGGSVSEKKSEAAAQRMHARATQRRWGDEVRRAIQQQWAVRGSAFTRVRIYRPSSPEAGPNPVSPEGLAGVPEPTLLFIHVVGPALTAEGDQLNPRIGPSLLLHWKVVDTRSGKVLALGTVAERSPLRKTLLEWASHGDDGMVPEMERVIRSAAARLATELR